MNETSLHGTVYGFLVDPSALEMEKMFNVNAYLMIKNKIF